MQCATNAQLPSPFLRPSRALTCLKTSSIDFQCNRVLHGGLTCQKKLESKKVFAESRTLMKGMQFSNSTSSTRQTHEFIMENKTISDEAIEVAWFVPNGRPWWSPMFHGILQQYLSILIPNPFISRFSLYAVFLFLLLRVHRRGQMNILLWVAVRFLLWGVDGLPFVRHIGMVTGLVVCGVPDNLDATVGKLNPVFAWNHLKLGVTWLNSAKIENPNADQILILKIFLYKKIVSCWLRVRERENIFHLNLCIYEFRYCPLPNL